MHQSVGSEQYLLTLLHKTWVDYSCFITYSTFMQLLVLYLPYCQVLCHSLPLFLVIRVATVAFYDQLAALHKLGRWNSNTEACSYTYAVAVHSSVSITALTHSQWRVALSIDTRRYTIWIQTNFSKIVNYTRQSNGLHSNLQLLSMASRRIHTCTRLACVRPGTAWEKAVVRLSGQWKSPTPELLTEYSGTPPLEMWTPYRS